VAALGLVLLGVGLVRSGAAPVPAPAVPTGVVVSPVGAVAAPVPAQRAAEAPAPVAVELPTLGVRAAVVPVAVGADGELAVPDDPRVVGWWAAGGRPSDPQAAVVLDGHVDSAVAGLGALFYLRTVVPGDAVVLTTADGARHGYVVTDAATYPKAGLPPSTFTTAGRLVLVTCGGAFDRATRQYADNVVVMARPADLPAGAPG
jgi:Sortase domain